MDLGIVLGILMIIGWLFLFLWIRRDAKLVGLPGSLWGIIACITPCFLGALFYYFVIRRDRMVCASCEKVNENKSNYCSECGEELDPSNKISFKLTKEFAGFVISMGASLIVLLYVVMVMLLPSYFKGEPFAVIMNGITEQEVVGHEFIFSNGIYDGRINFKGLKREITVSGDLTFGKGYMFIENQAGDMSYMIDLDKDRDEVTYDLSFMKGDVVNVRIEMQNAFNGWFRVGFELIEDSPVSQADIIKMKEYSNRYYEMNYPSHWVVDESVLVDFTTTFWNEERTAYFKVRTTNVSIDMYPEEVPEKFIEEVLHKKALKYEVGELSGFKAYMIEYDENDKKQIGYIVQNQDIVYEIIFECLSNSYKDYKEISNAMLNSFKINNTGHDKSIINEISTWNLYAEGPLEIYYPNDSMIANDVKGWAKDRIEAYDYICDYLNVEEKELPIKMYVFNAAEDGWKYGFQVGFAEPEKNFIFTTFEQTIGHEIAHVLSARINKGGNKRITSSLINEGLATRLDSSGRDYNRLAKEILEEKEYKIDILGSEFRKNEHAYILGASFVDYLINQYGMDNFKELFMQNEVNEEESFKKYYKKSGQALVDEWINSLKKK